LNKKGTIKNILENTLDRIDVQELELVFEWMLTGKLDEVTISAILIAWKYQSIDERILFAGAKTLKRFSQKGDVLWPSALTDNCGTGGDGKHTFNFSTASAFVAGSGGVLLAKHGNRSVSSLCGSADLLDFIGFPLFIKVQDSYQLLKSTGLTFLFAPNFHSGMKYLTPVREILGIKTVFNLLGPLANPFSPNKQLIGVSKKDELMPMAKAMQRLGIQKGMVVHSLDGLDEISSVACSEILHVTQQAVVQEILNPQKLGIKDDEKNLKGGNAAENASILQRLLAGEKDNTPRHAVALNAAALFLLNDFYDDWSSAYQQALKLLDSGRTKRFVNNWLSTAQKLATTK